MHIEQLNDDILGYVLDLLGHGDFERPWPPKQTVVPLQRRHQPPVLRVAAVSKRFLRVVQRNPIWIAAERIRLRGHGANLRGCYLRLRIQISIVTDTSQDFELPYSARPYGARRKRLCDTDHEESFESEWKLELPLWNWNERKKVDEYPVESLAVARAWAGRSYAPKPQDPELQFNFPRPTGLPPPILGAMAYKVQLADAALVLCRDGREQRRDLSTHGCGALLLDFDQVNLRAGEAMQYANDYILKPRHPNDAGVGLPYEDAWCVRLPHAVSEALNQVRRIGDDWSYEGHALSGPSYGLEADDELSYHIRFNPTYDMLRDNLCVSFGLRCDDAQANPLDYLSDPTKTPMFFSAILGEPLSTTALDPLSRRQQASSLSTWLRCGRTTSSEVRTRARELPRTDTEVAIETVFLHLKRHREWYSDMRQFCDPRDIKRAMAAFFISAEQVNEALEFLVAEQRLWRHHSLHGHLKYSA